MPEYTVYGESIIRTPITITFDADSLEHAKQLLVDEDYVIDNIEYDDADEAFNVDASTLEVSE
jgi:hypothetical protein